MLPLLTLGDVSDAASLPNRGARTAKTMVERRPHAPIKDDGSQYGDRNPKHLPGNQARLVPFLLTAEDGGNQGSHPGTQRGRTPEVSGYAGRQQDPQERYSHRKD